jgi:transcriptional regulator with XRE-family HTH domain
VDAADRRLGQELATFQCCRTGPLQGFQIFYAEFSRKLGVTKSLLFRLQNGQQSITLQRLEEILKRLKCEVVDVLGKKNG